MNRLFASSPITLASWLEVLVRSAVVFAVIEVEKWIGRRRFGRVAAAGRP